MSTSKPTTHRRSSRRHADDNPERTGRLIRQLRLNNEITQAELAVAVGFQRASSIAQIETGRRAITDGKLIKAARYLKVDATSIRSSIGKGEKTRSDVDIERFWEKVEQTDSCWNWKAAKGKGGYGRFRYEGRLGMAHKFAYELIHGTVPDGMEVDHVCHNTGCVNPAHLRLTTHKQNTENRQGADVDNWSGVRGVSWNEKQNVWVARVGHHGKIISAGNFTTQVEAEKAAKDLRLELFTHNNVDRAEVAR